MHYIITVITEFEFYPWYFDSPLIHGIWHPPPPLSMVFWPPNHGISTPYTWYFDPLPMVYQPPYPWYFDSLPMVYRPPYPWYFDTLSMVYRPPYLWYIDLLSMVFWPPYPWNFDPLTRGILTSLPISWLEMGGGKNTMGVQFTIQGGSVFNKGVQYTMDENWPRSQFTTGFKIPYDTGP